MEEARREQLEPQLENLEQEIQLTPEIVERIMEKVQDIGADGVAYANVGWIGSIDLVTWKDLEDAGVEKLRLQDDVEKLRGKIAESRVKAELEELNSIFKRGLIGVNQSRDREIDFKTFGRKEYHKYLKSIKRSQVHFNITGRNSLSRDIRKPAELDDILEIGLTSYMVRSGSVGIIFDISDLREVLPGKNTFDLGSGRKTEKIFSAANINDVAHWYGENQKGDFRRLHEYIGDDFLDHPERYLRLPGEPVTPIENKSFGHYVDKFLVTPSDEYGFITSPRVSPKKFLGVVISNIKKSPGRPGGWYTTECELYSDEELKNISMAIAKEMRDVDKEKSELLIPIYDTMGRVLWPKQMSYEEVKKLVVERESKKENKEEQEN